MRLGKQAYQHDEKTLQLSTFMTPIVVPPSYDFDHNRSKFPLEMWGNDQWGNCVKVGQANQLMRLERVEQRRTLKLTEQIVVDGYRDEVFREFQVHPSNAGDAADNGLVMLKNIANWRNLGWGLDFTKKAGDTRQYKIAAYGELEPGDTDQLKAAIYLLTGVQLGFWLPQAAQGKLEWDYNGEIEPQWKPGSWGGHCVYCKAYDGDEFQVLSWGRKITVTKQFIAKYCDESWAVVDDFDSWRHSRLIDIDALIEQLRQIGATGIQ